MNDCPFCRVLLLELETAKLGENEFAMAFLDLCPVNPGHTLVVPRRHVTSFVDLTERETAAVFQLIRQLVHALKSASASYQGITLSAADGEAADQEVPHAHFHVIPRCTDDAFGWRRYGERAEPEFLKSMASDLRQFMHEEG
ncbi:HIT domain-containing protein [Prosthecobacter sp. SYSU 5D2]|uniref:HIT family protein n=1 Tax=Prosthecobacter sp. SYSU 5D2 TaxID=3134134 RepID=UPI0031FE8BBC